MSSVEESDFDTSLRKRKRISRACDSCKRRKTRCVEPVPPNERCSNCISLGKRGRSKGYVDVLTKRIKLLEGLVKKLCPDESVLHGLIYPFDPEYATQLVSSISASPSSHSTPGAHETPPDATKQSSSVLDIIQKITSLSLSSNDDPFRDDHHEDVDKSRRMEQSKAMSIKPEIEEKRFYGPSNDATLVHAVISYKNEHSKKPHSIARHVKHRRRDELWMRMPWENDLAYPAVKYTFPSPDLIAKLVDAYFTHVNLISPLLHRPSFERDVANGLHLINEGFGGVLLLVCAAGSRYTETTDTRTLYEGLNSQFSAGWIWYNQVQVVKQKLFEPVTLYDLQSYCLAAEFHQGCYAPQAVWILTGIGIRLAQDVGAHRRRVPLEKMTIEDELWKRAFWVLVATDRQISMGLGRPPAIFDDHFDVDLPIECDDEYWEHPDPAQRFRQPKDIPSTVSGFNQHLRLFKIMAFAMGTIYSIKTKLFDLMLKEWEQHIVTELDSALNSWLISLPNYLRWDPNRTDDRFFKISGCLIITFYYIQMAIHRPYSSTKGQSTPLSLPSLTICTSAARSCSLVLEQYTNRVAIAYPHLQVIAFKTAVVLLLNIWRNKKIGAEPDRVSMRQVDRCMNVLRNAEVRWRTAGTTLDILNGLTATEISEETPQSTDQSEVPFYDTAESLPLWNDQPYYLCLNAGVAGYVPEQPGGFAPYNYNDADTFHFEDFAANTNTEFPLPDTSADSNLMAMWPNIPESFDINEWNLFLDSLR